MINFETYHEVRRLSRELNAITVIAMPSFCQPHPLLQRHGEDYATREEAPVNFALFVTEYYRVPPAQRDRLR